MEKNLCRPPVKNGPVYNNPSHFLKPSSFSYVKPYEFWKNVIKIIGPTLKITKGCKHVDFQ
jgi:hypothetical protein